ncbi:MAG: hypothetical protein QM704_27975 [Anaeromyxobacteraceae bacterium]
MPRRAKRLSPVLAPLLLALAGCPGARRGPPPERFLPADVRAAVVLPDAGRAAKDLAALHRTLSGFPGVGDAAALRGGIAAQLGFDPLDPEGLAEAGLDPARGAALALLDGPDEPSLLVLPVADVAKVEALLARLARQRLGAELRREERRGAASVVTLRRAEGAPPALAYALVERYALVSAGPAGPAIAGDAAGLDPARALAAAPAFAAARRALGDGEAAVAFLPPRAAAASGLAPLRDGAAVSLSASEGRLRVRAAVLLGDRAPGWLAALAPRGAGGALAGRLEAGAALVARLDADPAVLGPRLAGLVPAGPREALAARGLDLERDVFAVLGPGGAIAASLSPRFSLVGLTGEVLRDDPPRAFELEAVVPVRAGAAEAALRWARYADPARPPKAGPDGIVRVPTPSGEIAWKLVGDRLALACGRPGRLEPLLARLEAGAGEAWTPPVAGAKAALEGGPGGLVLDVPRLARSVRSLPPSSFGAGPTGFVVRSVIDRFVAPAERLSAVWLRAELLGDAVVVTLEAAARPADGERERAREGAPAP